MSECLIQLSLGKCQQDPAAPFIFRIMLALNDLEMTTYLIDYVRAYKDRRTSRKFMVTQSQQYLTLVQVSHCIEAYELLSTLRKDQNLSHLNELASTDSNIAEGYQKFFEYHDSAGKKEARRRIHNLRDNLVFHYNFISNNSKAKYTKNLISEMVVDNIYKPEVQFGDGEFNSPTCFFIANQMRIGAICKEWKISRDLRSFEEHVFPEIAEIVQVFRELAMPLCMSFCKNHAEMQLPQTYE